MFFRFCVIGLVLGSCFLSSAQSLRRGSLVCSDFKGAEALYQEDPNNAGSKTAYASCLIAKGKTDDGLWYLDEVIKHKSANEKIVATFLFAEYLETGGTFKTYDYHAIDQAIFYYDQTLSDINSLGYYPSRGNEETEAVNQFELSCHYNIPYLYMMKFGLGVVGFGNEHQFRTIDYIDEVYPDYSKTTMNSLEKAIQTATPCANLKYKRHFASDTYQDVKYICRTIIETARVLKPVEEKRLEAINNEFCRRNLANCKDFTDATYNIAKTLESMFNSLQSKTF